MVTKKNITTMITKRYPGKIPGIPGIPRIENDIKNMKEIIDALEEAVKATGKQLSEIPKKSIIDYLDKVGIPRSKQDEIYKQLVNTISRKETGRSFGSVTQGDSDRNSHSHQVVDYTDTTHNNVKPREPRKNVFSEITKVC